MRFLFSLLCCYLLTRRPFVFGRSLFNVPLFHIAATQKPELKPQPSDPLSTESLTTTMSWDPNGATTHTYHPSQSTYYPSHYPSTHTTYQPVIPGYASSSSLSFGYPAGYAGHSEHQEIDNGQGGWTTDEGTSGGSSFRRIVSGNQEVVLLDSDRACMVNNYLSMFWISAWFFFLGMVGE